MSCFPGSCFDNDDGAKRRMKRWLDTGEPVLSLEDIECIYDYMQFRGNNEESIRMFGKVLSSHNPSVKKIAFNVYGWRRAWIGDVLAFLVKNSTITDMNLRADFGSSMNDLIPTGLDAGNDFLFVMSHMSSLSTLSIDECLLPECIFSLSIFLTATKSLKELRIDANNWGDREWTVWPNNFDEVRQLGSALLENQSLEQVLFANNRLFQRLVFIFASMAFTPKRPSWNRLHLAQEEINKGIARFDGLDRLVATNWSFLTDLCIEQSKLDQISLASLPLGPSASIKKLSFRDCTFLPDSKQLFYDLLNQLDNLEEMNFDSSHFEENNRGVLMGILECLRDKKFLRVFRFAVFRFATEDEVLLDVEADGAALRDFLRHSPVEIFSLDQPCLGIKNVVSIISDIADTQSTRESCLRCLELPGTINCNKEGCKDDGALGSALATSKLKSFSLSHIGPRTLMSLARELPKMRELEKLSVETPQNFAEGDEGTHKLFETFLVEEDKKILLEAFEKNQSLVDSNVQLGSQFGALLGNFIGGSEFTTALYKHALMCALRNATQDMLDKRPDKFEQTPFGLVSAVYLCVWERRDKLRGRRVKLWELGLDKFIVDDEMKNFMLSVFYLLLKQNPDAIKND